MKEDVPSHTAQRVAMRRAAHQFLDHPRVFDDPLALSIIGTEAATMLQSEPDKFEASRHLRAFLAVRSRHAEDELTEAIARGATQYVVLGAGLDTYACRTARPQTLRVFEVDHPATQAWKRSRLETAGISIPSTLTFVPVDFERERLPDALHTAGFDPAQITFFSWLGVTPYLTAEAAISTLTFIASMPPDSAVVFDYAVTRSSLEPQEQLALDVLASRVAKAGEPFQLFLEPDALAGMLKAAGFHHLEDLGPREINQRYFSDRSDGLRIASGLAHLMHARV